MTRSVYYSWQDVEHMCVSLARQIRVRGISVDAILAVARGGLVPAMMLSHVLRVRDFDIIKASSYSDSHEKRALSVEMPRGLIDSRTYLVVDDIIDTGATMAYIKTHMPGNAIYASLTVKLNTPGVPGLGRASRVAYGDIINDDVWCVFPWEDV